MRNHAISQPMPIHIPGSKASVVTGAGTFHHLMRSLFRCGCRLGTFAKSFAAQRLSEPSGSTAEADLFPMPIPYPEVFKKSRPEDERGVALKKFVVTVVIVLNYLHLSRPKSIAATLKPQQKLSRRQWEGVRRLEGYAKAWLEVSPIGPEEMGRTAAKVESLEEILHQLEDQAAKLADCNSYFRQRTREDQEGDPQRKQSAPTGTQIAGGMTTFKEIDSSRLKFVGRPNFDPSPYLDPVSRKILFQDPLATRDPITAATRKPPRLRIHCSKNEKIRLFELLDSTDRLAFHKKSEVTPLFGSGLFAVTKSLEKDRMILDSRGANLLESPPGRWIRSLASSEVIGRYLLSEQEELTFSGNDLRDFYYFFDVSSSRSRRNVLVSPVRPQSVSHLKALKAEHLAEDEIYGALRTLAMGDCQAVELAQSCHLGLAATHQIVTPASLITMTKPPPRTSTAIGLVIDDFVTITQRPRTSRGPSEGAQKADEMLEVYEDVGLMPNKEKSFRDETQASFWGADADGDRGHVRGSLKRAVPLANLILRVVEVGCGTVDLLQTITGCIISLFLYRRRFLAILDGIFESYRGRGRREVVKLSGRVKSDLLMVVSLLPLAVSNLRHQAPDRVYASDASSWGEAAVHADISPVVGRELTRHVLRKSIWVRLLAPAAAWQRSRGNLEGGEEVPEEEEAYQSNPLWERLAKSLNFKLTFSKAKRAPRHINIGELRGALKAERIGAMRRPGGRLLVGLDSQVALGALIKGRSASPALNAELCRSISHMVLLDYSAEYFYFHTRVNPADDPTRGKAVRLAEEELPPWWKEAEEGRFEELDEWLRRFGLDDYSVAGLPAFEELMQSGRNGFTSGNPPDCRGRVEGEDEEAQTEPDREREAAEAEISTEAESASPRDLVPSTPRDFSFPPCRSGATAEESTEDEDWHSEPNGTGSQEDDQYRPDARTREEGAVEVSEVEGSGSEEPGCKQETVKEKKTRKRAGKARLSKKAIDILRSFPKDQFVLPKGCSWPPQEPGFLDLFSGERGVAKEAAKLGVWSLCFDLEHSPQEDLCSEELRRRLREVVLAGCFSALGGGPVCSSFSTAITPPVRDCEHPYGKPNLSPNMTAKVEEGNSFALWMFGLLRLAMENKLEVWLENPASSWMFRLPEWKELEKDYPKLQFWVVDYCQFGMEWRKRTKIATTSPLGGMKHLCKGDHQHRLLRGRCRQAKQSWTRVAQAYPRGVARSIAYFQCLSVGAIEDRPFQPGLCAKAGGMRIGEAAHPGPRRPAHPPRSGLLANVPLVEAKTRVLQSKVWLGFSNWLASRLSPAAMESALSQPALLVLLLQEYGNCLYEEGRALYLYRHLVVLVQQSFQHAKPFMGPAWSMIAKWEKLEPTAHRCPVPEAIFRAVISVSLCWGWRYFAAIVGITFLGITRPSEALFAVRKNLVLPEDRLEPTSTTAYLKIVKAKTSGRGNARIQHASFDDAKFVSFLETIFRGWSANRRLNACSSSAFRRRWDAVLESLEVPANCGLTPGGLRGGGCVTAYQRGCEIHRLMWRMRLRHQVTLENYLQEVTASTLVASLPSRSRRRIYGASSLYDILLQKHTSSSALAH